VFIKPVYETVPVCRCLVISPGELCVFIVIRLCWQQLLLLQAISKLVRSNNLVINVVSFSYGGEGSCFIVRVTFSWLVVLLSGAMNSERLVM
jgi:hypothetical protein